MNQIRQDVNLVESYNEVERNRYQCMWQRIVESCTLRSRGLASNLVLYDTAPGEMAQAAGLTRMKRNKSTRRAAYKL